MEECCEEPTDTMPGVEQQMQQQQLGYPQQMPYAPPPGHQPPPAYGPAPVMPIVMGRPHVHFGAKPVELDCPRCQAHVVTECAPQIGVMAWIMFAVLFSAGFFLIIPWCYSWIPFCIGSFKDVEHYCPNCKQLIGKYKSGGM